MKSAQAVWQEVFPHLGFPPPAQTITQRPWSVDRKATAVLQLDIAENTRVAGTFTELSWVLEADFKRQAFHSPRLVYCGAQSETRHPLNILRDNALIVHTHCTRDEVHPSEPDLDAFERARELHPSIGFGVLSCNAGRLYVLQPPTQEGPRPTYVKTWRLGRWMLVRGVAKAQR